MTTNLSLNDKQFVQHITYILTAYIQGATT